MDYIPTQEFCKLVEQNVSGMITTQAVEDSVCAGKSIGRSAIGPKFKRPERAMAAIIDQKIVDERHNFKTACPMTAGVPRSSRLPLDAFMLKKE